MTGEEINTDIHLPKSLSANFPGSSKAIPENIENLSNPSSESKCYEEIISSETKFEEKNYFVRPEDWERGMFFKYHPVQQGKINTDIFFVNNDTHRPVQRKWLTYNE